MLNKSFLDKGGGDGLDTTAGDARYLKLDCSNDPLTSTLEIAGNSGDGLLLTSAIASDFLIKPALSGLVFENTDTASSYFYFGGLDTGDVGITVLGGGSLEAVPVNWEYLTIEYDLSETEYLIHTTGVAGGSVRQMVLYTGANTDQLVLKTDGNNTMSGNLSLDTMTTGSVAFFGASGLISENNTNLFWDNDNDRLGVGTDAPANTLHVVGTAKITSTLDMSSQKILSLATPTDGTDATNKSYVDGLLTGLAWQEAVLEFVAVGGAVQTTGNRYIASATGGGWTENNIYEWSGSAWTETVAANNMALKNLDDNKFYTYNSTLTEWVDMGAAFDHNSLIGLQGGESAQYYHATEAEKNNWFIKNVDDTDNINEGTSNLFYTAARVNGLVQSSSSNYTIQGTWTYNNLITCANTPTDDSHLVRKSYVDDLLSGFTWQEPVLDKDINTPPGSPSFGDRYIVASASSDWYNSSWGYRQLITIDNTKVSGDETGFPVLIQIDAQDNEVFDNCQADGDDILFTTDDGQTKIPHEIEYIKTTTTKQLIAWVKTDISGSVDTEIYMYYGNATAGNQQEVTDVWDSDYKMVQHLNETSGLFYDSTDNNSDGTEGGGVTYDFAGKIGSGVYCDGSNDYIKISNNFVGTPSKLSISSWIKKESGGSSYECALHKASGTTIGGSDYWLGVDINDRLTATIGANTGIGWSAGQTTTTANYGQWYKLNATWDGSLVKVYIDGVFNKQYALTSYGNLTTPTRIGASSDGTTYQFKGSIDESRVSVTDRSANWIATSYENENDPTNFISVGAQQTPSAGGDWAGHVNDITEWDTLQWVFQTPSSGWAVIVTDEGKQYTWNGSAWVAGTATIAHNDTTSKQGGTTDEYYHLEQDEHTELTQWLDDVTLSTDGSMNIGAGDIATTGSITAVENITAAGIVQTEMVLANGAGSHPSGIGYYVELYVTGGSTGRILPYNGSSYCDLAIGDWNGGDPNIMLKTGGKVGINKGDPDYKLDVAGDFRATEAYLGDATTNIVIDTVVDPGMLTGTFNQLASTANAGANELLYMPQGIYMEGTNPISYLDWHGDSSFYVSANIYDIATYESDPTGAGVVYGNAAMVVKAARSGTIDGYAAGQSEINAVHYFGMTNSATYSGSEDLDIINVPLVTELIVSPTINDATSDFVLGNVGQMVTVIDETPAETCNSLTTVLVGEQIVIESNLATRTADSQACIGIWLTGWNLRAGDEVGAYGIRDDTGYNWFLGEDQFIEFGSDSTKIGSDDSGYMDYYCNASHRFNNTTADLDIILEFIGTSNSGQMIWREDTANFYFDSPIDVSPTITASSGRESGIEANLTCNQSGSAYYTGFYLNVTETSTGSGSDYLMQLAVDTDVMFAISAAGDVFLESHIYAAETSFIYWGNSYSGPRIGQQTSGDDFLYMLGGFESTGSNDGEAVYIFGGSSPSTGSGGDVYVQAGYGRTGSTSGDLYLDGGGIPYGQTPTAGSIYLRTGNAATRLTIDEDGFSTFAKNLKITTGSNSTYFETSELDWDLTGAAMGHMYIPVLQGKMNGTVIPFTYGMGIYERMAIIDIDDEGACSILFASSDFLTANGELVCDLDNSYFTVDLDWNPASDDSRDLGSSSLQWKDLYINGVAYIDDITMSDAGNITVNTTTGTKIGTATNQKLGFFNATPVVQQTGYAVPTDLATCITALTTLRTALNNLGLQTVV